MCTECDTCFHFAACRGCSEFGFCFEGVFSFKAKPRRALGIIIWCQFPHYIKILCPTREGGLISMNMKVQQSLRNAVQ